MTEHLLPSRQPALVLGRKMKRPKIRANNIKGRSLQFLDSQEDIAWALDIHVPSEVKNSFSPVPLAPSTCKGIIMTGNEDFPDQVWATVNDNPNHINTMYTLVAGNIDPI